MTAAQQIQKGTDLMLRGDLNQARLIAEQTVRQHPKNSAAYALFSEVEFRRNRISEASQLIDKAVSLTPDNPNWMVQKARCYVVLGDIAIAQQSVQQALKMSSLSTEQLLLLAAVLVRCDAHQKALTIYQKILAESPENVDAHRGLATTFRILGKPDEAEAECNWVLSKKADDYELYYLRSSLKRRTAESNHVDELTTIFEKGIKDWRGKVQIAYSLAKEFEDLGDYDQSFKYLHQGASLRRSHTRYDLDNDLKIFAAIREHFCKEVVAENTQAGCPSNAPIFVLGLPRTGSTLVERVISSHSDVHMAGELNDFALEMVKLATKENGGAPVPRLDLPRASTQLNWNELGENYIKITKDSAGSKKRFIDKLPLNFLYIGLIHLALPNAKIVHVRRNPMDACYAIYKYLFKQAYPFSYDLKELASYYIAYHQMMEHWRRVLPGRIYDISYEKLIADQESESKQLLDHLDLDWQDNCLNFHLNAQPSTTGSASQVRELLYNSSVGKWRRYEQHLTPLKVALEEAGIEIT